jgi:hypothetical protein
VNTHVMGAEMNPYIVDVPTRFSFFGKSKKKAAKTDDEHEKNMSMSQAALEFATNKARDDVNNAMQKANADLKRDQDEFARVEAKRDKSARKHEELERKNAQYSALLQHDKADGALLGQGPAGEDEEQ